ncbi:hypothetical protein KCU60_g10717, partial [Aureobasidium melanogenum]
ALNEQEDKVKQSISDLEEQIDKLHAEYTATLKNKEDELVASQNNLEKAETQLADSQKSFADEIAALEQGISGLEEQIQKARSEHQDVLRAKESELSELRGNLALAESKAADTEKSLADARHSLDDVRDVDSVQNHEGELKDLQIVVSRFQAQVAALEQDKEDLTKALEEKSVALGQAGTTHNDESKAELSRTAMDGLRDQVTTLTSEKNDLTKTFEEKTSTLEQTISSLEDQMQQAHIAHENALNDKNQQILDLNELLEKDQASASDEMESDDDHSAELKNLQVLIDQLQAQVATLESAKDELNKDLEAKVAAHEQTLSDLEKQIQQAHSDHATALETKDISISEAQEALEWARGKASDTEKIIESKDNELSILRETLEKVQTEASSTRKSLHESRASFDGLQKDKSSTEELLAQIKRERMESESALQRRNAEINDLWASLEQSQAGSREALAELQSLRENNTAISDLERQMKQLRSENEKAIRSRDSEIRKLREAVERGELAASNLQQARTAMSDMETQFEDQLAQLEHQIRKKQTEFDDLRESYERSQADYAEMGDLLGTTNERLQKSYVEAERLQEQLNSKNDEVFSLNVSLESAQRKTAEKQAELTELRSSREDETTALRNQLNQQTQAVEKAQAEAEDLKASLEEARVEITALQSAQSAGAELEQHIQYVHAEYEETLQAKNAEIEQHRAAFEKAQQEAADFARTLADSTAELEELHKSIDVLTIDGGNKDTDHAAAIARVEKELKDKHIEEIRSIQEAHTWELAGLQREPDTRSPDSFRKALIQEKRELEVAFAETERLYVEEVESLKSAMHAQIAELRDELATTTDEKFELMQKLDEVQGQREGTPATPTSPLSAQKKLSALRADYDARVLEFETRHRDLVRQQEETLEGHRAETEAKLQQAEERRRELIREHEENLFNQAAEFEKSKNFSVDALNARHYTELKKRDDVIDSLREELNSLKKQVQRLRAADSGAQSPAINVETSEPQSVEDRDVSAEAIPCALEEGTRFEEFLTPMETQEEQEPQFEEAGTTQASAPADSDADSDNSYDMDFTHLDSQIGDPETDPAATKLTVDTAKTTTTSADDETSTPLDQQPPSATTTYSNSALTSQLAHLEAALELSRKETFHERAALQAQLTSLRAELSATKQEKASLQSKLANFNAAMDERADAVFELGGVEDDDVFYTGDKDGQEGKKKRTIEGTLASLRLQAKQLEELNEEFLSQSMRWSGILPLKQM